MRHLTPSNVVTATIIGAVAVMIGFWNWSDLRQKRARSAVRSRAPLALSTSRADLDRTIKELDARVASRPDDIRSAVVLADAIVRQTRVTGNAGLAMRAEKALKKALVEDPGNYEANRALASVYLSQHRF